jgi:hypothetical protein
MMVLDPQERHVAFAAARRYIDGTGYGSYVNDAIVQGLADSVANAIEAYRAGAMVPKKNFQEDQAEKTAAKAKPGESD